MRPGMWMMVWVGLLAVGAVGADVVTVTCDQCDASCAAQCTDSCYSFQIPEYSCNDTSVVTATCRCKWDLDLPIDAEIFFSVVFAVLISVFAFSLAYVVYTWCTDAQREIKPAPEGTFRVYSARNPFVYRQLLHAVDCLSFGLLRPCTLIEDTRMQMRRVNARGLHMVFDAAWHAYCLAVYLPNLILVVATCGIWWCFGLAEKREVTWMDRHTHVVGAEEEPVVFHAALAGWWWRGFSWLISALTFGCAYSWFYALNEHTAVSRMDLAGRRVAFVGVAEDYYVTSWLISYLCGIFTCGLSSCLGLGDWMEENYTDKHLIPGIRDEEEGLLCEKEDGVSYAEDWYSREERPYGTMLPPMQPVPIVVSLPNSSSEQVAPFPGVVTIQEPERITHHEPRATPPPSPPAALLMGEDL